MTKNLEIKLIKEEDIPEGAVFLEERIVTSYTSAGSKRLPARYYSPINWASLEEVNKNGPSGASYAVIDVDKSKQFPSFEKAGRRYLHKRYVKYFADPSKNSKK